MCGRFTLSTSAEVVAEFFELDAKPELTPRYNIAPTQPVLGVVAGKDGARSAHAYHWGLVPSWAKDASIGSRMINARAETVANKPSFRSAFAQRRCLIPASGFYEWKKLDRGKRPYLIGMGDGQVFALAGLWERWHGSHGTALESCTVITTEPNELMGTIHNRMPVILPRELHAAWLDPQETSSESVLPMLRAYPAASMKAVEVSAHVNSPAHDDVECVEPVGSDDPEGRGLFL